MLYRIGRLLGYGFIHWHTLDPQRSCNTGVLSTELSIYSDLCFSFVVTWLMILNYLLYKPDLPTSVISGIKTIMTLVTEERDEIFLELLISLLNSVKNDTQEMKHGNPFKCISWNSVFDMGSNPTSGQKRSSRRKDNPLYKKCKRANVRSGKKVKNSRSRTKASIK